MVTDSKDDDDGFLTTLHALQKVIQPADELYKQVHTLQKENRTLFEKLEALRQESQEQLQAVQEESRAKLQQQEKKWQETIQALEEQAREASLQFETDLVKKTERMKEMELERRAILEKSEEEQKAFEESMIQLESENKNLKERCAEAEKMGSKLQTEVCKAVMHDSTYIVYMYNKSDCIFYVISSIRGRTPLNNPKWPCKRRANSFPIQNQTRRKLTSTRKQLE